MHPLEQDTGIAKNIRVVEWLKADLLTSVSALFKSMLRGSEEYIQDALASLIITCYVLGRRLGVSFSRLELKMESKLRQSIGEDHELERWYSDLSTLLSHLLEKKR
ncbi:MAG: MazG-like family protein [Armatimonadetes bacterium]|nr:MazG-like family protein [Armatimonadota bacterium]